MKKWILLSLLSLPALATVQYTEIGRCTNATPGGQGYKFFAGHDAQANQTSLKVETLTANPNAPVDAFEFDNNPYNIWGYGNTTIVTHNNGRSGYLHIYIGPQTSLIDINLFSLPARALNTNGAKTQLTCNIRPI